MRLFIILCISGFLTGCMPPAVSLTAPATAVSIASTPTPVRLVQATTAHTPTAEVPTVTPTSDPGIDDLENYYGGLAVTLDDVGTTFLLRPRQGFILRLGDTYDWTVSVEPEGAVTRNSKITPEAGEQGVFIARQKGRAILTATGAPVCRKEAVPCALPDVRFQIVLEVQ